MWALNGNLARYLLDDKVSAVRLSELRSAGSWLILLVVLGLQLPLFTGGRIRGAKDAARASLEDSRLRLQQTRELAEVDLRNVVTTYKAAQAAYDASSGTTQQAQRAYEIAQVRYREGISTQTELADSRLLLQQAEAQRAQAARTLQVARLRLAVLRDLPLGV
jgi:outer membrane protein TolC